MIKKYSIVTDVVFGGSFAKGTWLKNEADIDIFVKFNNQTSLEDFENYGKEIGLQSLKNYSPYLRDYMLIIHMLKPMLRLLK